MLGRDRQYKDVGTGTFAQRAAYLRTSPVHTTGFQDYLKPVEDPHGQMAAALLAADFSIGVELGVVVDVLPTRHLYKIVLDALQPPQTAVYAGCGGFAFIGARPVGVLLPGTRVICVKLQGIDHYMILAALPTFTVGGVEAQSILSNHSVINPNDADVYASQLSGVYDRPGVAAGRPMDSPGVGEIGWITETGMRIYLDPFIAKIGGLENSQLTFFHHDGLVRMSACQWQHWTSCREEESLLDEGELHDWVGYAMYPWELYGQFQPGDPTITRTSKEWQETAPWSNTLDLDNPQAAAWHRVREFHGYLGQGGYRVVTAPPEGADEGSLPPVQYNPDEPFRFPGLFNEFVTADGRYCLQSAKGITLAKRPRIVSPTRKRRVEDPAGDNSETYRASGIFGSGPEHKITGDLEAAGEYPNATRTAAILDLHAYMFNYAGIHPFEYHSEDFDVPDEADYASEGFAVPDYSVLNTSMYLSAEDYYDEVYIDHRYGKTRIYNLPCGIDFLEDGGVVLYDGYGSEIRMTGGNIEIAAAGDIWLRSGRNVVQWAGQDAITRSRNAVDISTSEGSLRLKAEKDLAMLAGNSGTGGVMIESRGAGDNTVDGLGDDLQYSGITLKSTYGETTIYGRNGLALASGFDVVVDAAAGSGAFVVTANSGQMYLQSGLYGHFDWVNEGGNSSVEGPTFALTRHSSFLLGTTCIRGGIIADGSMILSGGAAMKGNIAAGNTNVGKTEGETLEQIEKAIEECREGAEDQLPTFGDTILGGVSERFYADGKSLNPDIQEKLGFSFRTTADYSAESFLLYEDRWQQLRREFGDGGGEYWSERPATYSGKDTYPYPGEKIFKASGDESRYRLVNHTMVDRGTRASKSRNSAEYENPKYGEETGASLSSYRVI